uniref:Uncharacterized protein n=1 Tax=Arcella intermedia TaxID=1963864 RepID=A0A6B2LTY8_9EUKA
MLRRPWRSATTNMSAFCIPILQQASKYKVMFSLSISGCILPFFLGSHIFLMIEGLTIFIILHNSRPSLRTGQRSSLTLGTCSWSTP